jgi:hypothetical protein
MVFYYSHFHIIISNYTFYSGIASKAMLLLLNVIEMIVYIKHLYYGRFDDFHRLLIFHSYPNKKKIKEYVNRKKEGTILVIKIPTLSSLLWVVNV